MNKDLRNLAACFYRMGRWLDALQVARQLLLRGEDGADLHKMIGMCHLALRNFAMCEAHLQCVVSLKDSWDTDVAAGLAYCAFKLQRYDRCKEQALLVLQNNPEHAQGNFLMGEYYRIKDQPEEALQYFKICVESASGYRDAYMQMGMIHADCGQFDRAIESYNHLIRLNPSDWNGWYRLGSVLHVQGDLAAAEMCLSRALDLLPDAPEPYLQVGMLEADKGDMDKALEIVARVQRAWPHYKFARINEAILLERSGAIAHARDLAGDLVKAFPKNPHVLMLLGRTSESIEELSQAAESIAAALDHDKNIPYNMRAILNFVLASVFERIADVAQAMKYYHAGNAMRAEMKPYQKENTESFFSRIQDTYPAFKSKVDGYSPRQAEGEPEIIFIVGMPRSGTTLVEQILAAHPEVSPGGEMQLLDLSIRNIIADFRGSLDAITTEVLEGIRRYYLENLPKSLKSCQKITDKMPHNFQYAGMIQKIFPSARIVYTVRDPLDNCLSCYCQDFLQGNAFSFDLDVCAHFYKMHRSLMTMWSKDIDLYELHYEQLVENPIDVIQGLLSYCGLGWDDGCLKYYENKRYINTASYKQANKPLYTSSIRKWKRYAEYIHPLIRSLQE